MGAFDKFNDFKTEFDAEAWAMEQMANQTDDDYYLKLLESGIFTENGMLGLISSEKLSRKQKRELLVNIGTPTKRELGTWVKIFYNLQDYRKAAREQIRSMTKIEEDRAKAEGREPNIHSDFNDLILANATIMEKNIQDMLTVLVLNDTVGQWLVQVTGIGIVLAANIMATFDVEGRQYASQFHSYCGMNDQNRPWLGADKSKKLVNDVIDEFADKARREAMIEFIATNYSGINLEEVHKMETDEIWTKVLEENKKFKKKVKQPSLTDDMIIEIAARSQWNEDYIRKNAYDADKGKWDKQKVINACAKVPYSRPAKTLMYKIGQSFVWVSNKEQSLYGKIFRERKVEEIRKNEQLLFKDQAEKILVERNVSPDKKIYPYLIKGMLPPSHIVMRSMRIAEKVFVSHVFDEMYRVHYDKIPPKYYALEHLDGMHNREIAPEVPFTLVSSEV